MREIHIVGSVSMKFLPLKRETSGLTDGSLLTESRQLELTFRKITIRKRVSEKGGLLTFRYHVKNKSIKFYGL